MFAKYNTINLTRSNSVMNSRHE